MIINESLMVSLLPTQWLSSIVIPLYKKSYRYVPLNYRGIHLTSVTCKVAERLVVQHLMNFLNDNDILNVKQYGFRANHSTVDQLICTYNDISRMVDGWQIVDLIFFDFSKALDCVNHAILISKLHSLGIWGDILECIRAFLTGRTMKVKVGTSLSGTKPVTSGVPQGSVLGPILFLIYVNFAVNNMKCYYQIFADDTKLYLGFGMEDELGALNEFQDSISRLVACSSSWGLKMNIDKCVVMRFCRNRYDVQFTGVSPYHIEGKSINFVTSHSDLGVTVDRDLKFHSHINSKATTCNSMITNIFSCILCREEKFMLNLYKTYLRPILEYASSLWNCGYVADLRKLERIQRRWTRSISGLSELPYHDRLRKLDLFSVQGRLLRADLILVYKIINNLCSINGIFIQCPLPNIRGHPHKLFKPRAQLELRRRFFNVRIIDTWNRLSSDTVTAANINIFKSLLRRDLGDNLFQYV